MKYHISCLAFILCMSSHLSAQLYINEIVASNDATLADNYGEYDDWIEIYNAGASAIDLSGYYLSDDATNPTLSQIPATNAALSTVPAGGYLIFWADNETTQGENHLNFKLSSSGESVVLTATDGTTTIDAVSFPALITDYGYGRLPDGSNNLSALTPASPASTNNNSQPKVAKPLISLPSGVYTGTQTVSITAETGATIYYTTDGSTPTTASNIYNSPINVASIQSVRAIAVKSGFADSFVATGTYLINFNSSLPVFYISTDPDNLYGDTNGIYVEGTNGIIGYCDLNTPYNWNQSWERPAHLKVFKNGQVIAENNIGIKISGNCKRNQVQKPMTLFFRDEYSDTADNEFEYKIFPDNELDKFKRLFIRSGNNTISDLLRDISVSRMIQDKMDIEVQSGQPAIIFFNGDYIGIQNIREKFDKWHFENDRKNVQNKDSVAIIKNPGRYAPVERWWALQRATNGDSLEWRALMDYIIATDFTNQSNYETIKEQIDINELLNYLISGHFFGNTDWIINNQKTWKEKGSGKWRWCLFDFDSALNPNNTVPNNLANRMLKVRSPNSPLYEVNILYLKLFQNNEFKYEYIQRMNTYTEDVFTPSRFDTVIDNYYNEILPDLPDANALYGHTFADYQSEIQSEKDFIAQRGEYVRQHMRTQFGLADTFQLNINFDATSNGTVALHTNYYDLPYNYSGWYHKNVRILIHAIPNPGYRFVKWIGTGGVNQYKSSIYRLFNPNNDVKDLTPIFEPALDVVINEIHYHPNDTINNKEFIEIYNPDTTARDLSAYEFSEGICFKFPKGTTINPGEYIVIAADATQYAGNGYQVFQWEDSKLNNDGENLILQNPIKTTIDTLRYNDGIPWALLADGFGASLELNYPVPTDNIIAADWHASAPIGGTPGAQNSMPCTTPTQEIVINEINYNSDNTTNPGDWIELHNPNSTSIDISNWQFYDSENTFTLPTGTMLGSGEFLVLAEDATQFGSIFPHLNNGTDYIGNLAFNISNGGERVSLFDQNKCLSDELLFNDKIPWDSIPDGNGPTLSLITPNSDNTLPQSWEASANINSAYGTPGRANEPCPVPQIMMPDTIYSGTDTLLTVDIPDAHTSYTWVVIGATSSNSNADSTVVNWANPGTYNIQLISNYFECIKVSFKQVVVVPNCVDIQLHAYLEGAFDPALSEMRTTLVATRKLLPGQTPTSGLASPTPAGQPYSAAPWNYTGTEGTSWTDADYTGDETDWVLVSFRTDIQKNTEVGMTAGLLMKDGSITFPDRCALTSTVASPLYMVIEHRNHIGVMTPQPIDVIGSTLTYDFRLADSYRDPTSFGQKQLPTGEWTMYAGDADQSDFPSFDIKGTDKTIWFDNNGIFDYYFSPDFNLDGDINGQDKTLWFDNNGISSRVPK